MITSIEVYIRLGLGFGLAVAAALGCPTPADQSDGILITPAIGGLTPPMSVVHTSYAQLSHSIIFGCHSLVWFWVPWCSTGLGLGLRCTVGFRVSDVGTVIV